MSVLLNELSLNGQFTSIDEFNTSLEDIIFFYKLLKKMDIQTATSCDIYSCNVYDNKPLGLVLSQCKTTEITAFKRILDLERNFFWNSNTKQNDTDLYKYNDVRINNSSLAEACEERKEIISLKHDDFLMEKLTIIKNSTDINLNNFTHKYVFLDYYFEQGLFDNKLEDYFKYRFNERFDFSECDERHSFNNLNREIAERFISTFKKFTEMSWEDIDLDDGIRYKKYDGPWFKNTSHEDKDIMKLRVSRCYRCYGYRMNNKFLVLRFELNHKVSDGN